MVDATRKKTMPKKAKKTPIKIMVISGSVQPGNYTSKALALVIDEIRRYPQFQSEIIDPIKLRLPLPGEKDNAARKKLQRLGAEAVGFVLATPEYHGSYSSVIKLVIDNLGYPSHLSGKPVALLGVASGKIGAVKALEHLRGVCAHVGAMVLPWSISVSSIMRKFDEQGRCLDKPTEDEIRSVGRGLVRYLETHASALTAKKNK